MISLRGKLVTDGRTNGRINGSKSIGPTTQRVGGPIRLSIPSRDTLGGREYAANFYWNSWGPLQNLESSRFLRGSSRPRVRNISSCLGSSILGVFILTNIIAEVRDQMGMMRSSQQIMVCEPSMPGAGLSS